MSKQNKKKEGKKKTTTQGETLRETRLIGGTFVIYKAIPKHVERIFKKSLRVFTITKAALRTIL